MAGHSKWAQIKRSKGIKDVKKSSTFSKLSKDITVAVKIGGSGDADFNPSLRVAIDKAKASNMPNDKIKSAIDKGLGINSDGIISVENTYEAYGPNQVAVLIDCETDNPNRTLTDIKTNLTKKGGKFLSEGSISWQFYETGRIILKVKETANIEDISLDLLDFKGITDLKRKEEFIYLLVDKTFIGDISKEISEKFKEELEVETIDLIKTSDTKVQLDRDSYLQIEEFLESLENLDDVVNVWSNVEIL